MNGTWVFPVCRDDIGWENAQSAGLLRIVYTRVALVSALASVNLLDVPEPVRLRFDIRMLIAVDLDLVE